MKLLCPGLERSDTGGGSTFLKNLSKSITAFGHQCVTEGEYDMLFIAGASLCDRSIFEKAQADKKPIILRVDNLLEDRRNKGGSGMNKMREYAKGADVVIFQSEWAKKFLSPVIGKTGIVIKNGVDTNIFYPEGKEVKSIDAPHTFIYSKYSRGEGKHFEVVQQWWREHHLVRPQDTLLLAGNFAREYFESPHPFEFHNGEKFRYLGIAQSQEEMAEWFRSADCAVLPYFADACSNTILEAQATGLYLLYDASGGTPEIVFNGEELRMDLPVEDLMKAIQHMGHFDFQLFKDTHGLPVMAGRYDALIKTMISANQEVVID